ncbi:MAG: hypothetical protein GX570_03985 [Corynebacterium marinum]|jgi:hypothetical protein|uniref:Uncharacterized protein n=3 Tax=Corynebacterium marinum TaxID=349751 RepID=A0A0B6TDP8_9CORY|nr:hypothetical protein B840_02120 [Corynebacterium marinum DSM 44953]NLF90490.1 hypothetical protein [Corynebacterium marinum]GGO11052.1 hypothetical protein GCM10010980_01940 [Corynebacterium marinum]
MEFEEFSRQFRQRTTQRMVEFEKALAQAQQRVEKAVTPPTAPLAQRETRASPATPDGVQQRPRPGTARGRVQGLLRKG